MITDEKKRLTVSYSSLGSLESCPRKFEFNKIWKNNKKRPRQFAAEVGTALHKAYQNYVVTQDKDAALWELLLAYPHDLYIYQKNDYRSIQAAIITMDAMIESNLFNEWDIVDIKNHEGDVVPAVEVSYELQIDGIDFEEGTGFSHIGFIDLILKHRMTGKIGVVDIKTHRANAQDYEGKYKYNTQQVPYGLVLNHVLNLPVTEFEVFYFDVYVDVAEPRVNIYPYTKNHNDIQEWLQTCILKLQHIKQYKDLDYFPRTENGCIAFNSPCAYMDVCQSREPAFIRSWLEIDSLEDEVRDPAWIVVKINPWEN